jgi:hypothetical protein
MFSIRSSIAVLYLAVLGSVVAYTAYNYAQTKLSAGKVSSYALSIRRSRCSRERFFCASRSRCA